MQTAPTLFSLVLGRSLALWRSGFPRFIGPLAAILLPSAAMEIYAGTSSKAALGLGDPYRPPVSLLVILIVRIVSQAFGYGIVTSVLCDLLAERRVSVHDAFERAGRRFMRLLLVSFVYWLSLAAGLCTLGVLTVFFAARWLTVPPIAFCENQPAGRAFQRSDDLTIGFRDQTAMIFLSMIFPITIAGTAANFLSSAYGGPIATSVTGWIVSALTVAVVQVVQTATYLELRRAKENPKLVDLFEEDPLPSDDDDFE